MKDNSVCFSGHRDIPKEEYNEIYKSLLEVIEDLIYKGYTDFYCGGAVGFDMMAETAVIDLKRTFSDIKLHLILPYVGHDKSWNNIDKQKFKVISGCAETIEHCYDHYVRWSFMERNQKMVDSSSVLVCHLTKNSGGTYRTVSYAKKNKLEIISI